MHISGNFIVSDLTRPRIERTIYNTLEDCDDHYSTKAFVWKFIRDACLMLFVR
jgi:hypothetical protein